jgi:hypothetical protein
VVGEVLASIDLSHHRADLLLPPRYRTVVQDKEKLMIILIFPEETRMPAMEVFAHEDGTVEILNRHGSFFFAPDFEVTPVDLALESHSK